MEFIAVQSFNNYIEAHIAMGYLQQQHINCWLKDEYTVTIDPILTNAVGGIKLMVASVQVPRAIELLNHTAGYEKLLHICPHCGSRNIQPVNTLRHKEHWLKSLLQILLGKHASTSMHYWHCLACGKDCKTPAKIPAETMEKAE